MAKEISTVEVNISSNDQRFFDAIEHPREFIPYLTRAAEGMGQALITELEQYPPTTEANQPGRWSPRTHRPMGFYERGRGWWAPVWKRSKLVRDAPVINPGQAWSAPPGTSKIKLKAIVIRRSLGGTQDLMGTAGYKLRPTSQQLGENWVMIVSHNVEDVLLTVGNPVSYSGFVQQRLDQAMALRKYGWRTIEDIIESPFFDEVTRARMSEAYSEFYGIGGFGL